MQDFCFRASDEAAIISALKSMGLTTPDLDRDQRPVGVYCYDGQVVDQPGKYDIGLDGAMTTIVEPTYLPGVYAKYRATDEQAEIIRASTLPAGVEIVAPPASLPLFGGMWLGGPALDAIKAAACSRITEECARRRAAGVLVQFPDGMGAVQTRDVIDLVNVTGVASAGLAATVAGTMPPLYFRDAANDNHDLTPTQAVDFGAQVMQQLQAITKAAHDAKDAINRPEVDTLEQVAAIESTIVWP